MDIHMTTIKGHNWERLKDVKQIGTIRKGKRLQFDQYCLSWQGFNDLTLKFLMNLISLYWKITVKTFVFTSGRWIAEMERVVAAVVSILCLLIPRGTTYSTGAPAEGCWSERPLHGDFLPQGGSDLPYQIITNATSYGPSQTIMGKGLISPTLTFILFF